MIASRVVSGAVRKRTKERTRLAGAAIGPKAMRAGLDRMPQRPGGRISTLIEPACSQHVEDRVGPRGWVRQVWAVGRGAHCCAGGRMQRDIGDQGEKALDVSAVLPMMRRGEVQPPRWWYPVGRRVVPLTLRHFELHQFDPRALSSSTTSSRPWCRASRRTTSVLDGRPSPCATTPSFPMKGWLPHHRAIGAAVLPQRLETQHAVRFLASRRRNSSEAFAAAWIPVASAIPDE